MTVVYHDEKMYAGWPANHGAWQWGDEFLVGFMRGPYSEANSMHHIGQPFERMLARSLDGGETWSVETPRTTEGLPVFECKAVYRRPPNPAGYIARVCGVYDHGGDETDEHGGFYLSCDRGKYWYGPYGFGGLEQTLGEDLICTARTRVVDELFFLSAGQRAFWGTDFTFCARYDPSKLRFEFVSNVLEDEARAVMPAVATIGKRMVACLRRRKGGRRQGWIDSVYSDTGGVSWSKPAFVAYTGSHNGNPPALLALPDGRLLCCYGNRDFGAVCYALSNDGVRWREDLQTVAKDGEKDIGYPQLFLRSDGVPICVYYWADKERPQQHILASEVKV